MKRKNLNKLWKQWISVILVLVMITLAPISSMAEVGYGISELMKREYQDLVYGDVGTPSDANREEAVSEEEEDWSDGLEGGTPSDAVTGTPSDAVMGTPSDAGRFPRESGEYRVTFYVDGKVWDTQFVEKGGSAYEPSNPEKEGHTFIGWSGQYQAVTSSRSITAQFVQGEYETHRVEFLDHEETPIGNPRYVIDGSDASQPYAPVKQGHTFFGWDTPTYRIHEDKVFRPTYREGTYKTYVVSYYGYSSEIPEKKILLKQEYVAEGEDSVPPEMEERAGYTFAGWERGIYRNVRYNQTLHAWYHSGKVETHKVEFLNAEGVPIGNPQYVIDGSDAACPNPPVKTGYTFFGWDTPTYRIHEDKVFRPTYREGSHKTYVVYYYGYSSEIPGKKILLKQEYVAEGEDSVPPELEERAGYTFAGWERGIYRNVRYNQIIAARYHSGKVETHKVEFLNAEGVPIGNPQYVIDGSDASQPYAPVKQGHTFFGWDTPTYRIHEDKVFRPTYREGTYKTYGVSYYGYSSEAPGREILLKYEYVAEGEDSVPPELEERAGYTFAGWAYAQYRNVRNHQTLHAWYHSGNVETHKIEFLNAEGVPIGNPQYVIDGRDASQPYAPVKKGYTFFGWDMPTYRIHEDKVFRPTYREGSHKTHVVYYYGYSSEIPGKKILLKQEYVAEGEDSTPPELEARAGYTFSGWSYGEYRNVRSSRSIHASYHSGNVETHKIEFLNAEGVPIGNPQYVIDGRDALRPGNPLKTGYTFFGWNEPTYRIHRDITFRPTYRKGSYKTFLLYYYGYSSELPGSTILLKEEWVAEGEDGEPPVLEKWNGYTFSKWKNGEYRNVRSSQVLYAEYHSGNAKTYKVEFLDGEGMPIGNPQYVIAGNDPLRPSNPWKEGYTFFGWDGLTYGIYRDTVFRPIYREGIQNAYRILYYGRSKLLPGKSVILKEEWVAEGEDSEPPELETIKGLTFAGWEKEKLYTNITSSRSIYATYYTGKEKTHKVEYVDEEGNALYNPQYVIHGKDAIRPSNPPKAGYTFFGWDTPHYRIQKDVVIRPTYRKGIQKTFQVYYYGRSSERPGESILLKEDWVIEGEDSEPPELETVKGLTFAGWEKEKLYTNITSSRSIYATYYTGKEKTHKVEYVDEEGNALYNPQYVIHGKDAVRPSNPPKAGYTFFGWDTPHYRIEKDVVIRPTYRKGIHKTFQVYYYGRSSERPGESILLKEDWVIEGEDSEPPELETVKGFTFAGWEKEKLYTNITSSRSIYATYYTGKQNTHKVEYVDEEGNAIYNPQYVIHGKDAIRPSNPPKAGYTFFGWDTPHYRIQKDTVIHPTYREGIYQTYQVYYYGRSNEFPGSNILLKEDWVAAGEDSIPPVLEEGKNDTFAGWDRQILYTNIKSSRTIYAMYHGGKIKTYRVEYVDHEGRPIYNPQYVAAGNDAVRPPNPTRTGYTFFGWDTPYYRIHKNVVIRPTYREGTYKTLQVSYYGRSNEDPGNGILLKEDWIAEGEDSVPPVLEEMENYTFAGWEKTVPYTNVMSSRRLNAYYYNGKVKTHKIEYVDHGGEVIYNPQYVIDGGSPSVPPDPKRPGYTFLGWDQEFYRITEPLKIKPRYGMGEFPTWKVRFYGKITGNAVNLLLKEEYVAQGGSAHPPQLPVNASYQFREWKGSYTNVWNDRNIIAQYDHQPESTRSYTVSFWADGQLLKSETVLEGGRAAAPAAPVKKGYIFVGWDRSYVAVTGNLDVQALYEEDTTGQKKREAFRRDMAELELSKPVEEAFVKLGEVMFDEQEKTRQSRMPLAALLGPYIVKVAVAAVASYVSYTVIKDVVEEVFAIFTLYFGGDWSREVAERFGVEVETELEKVGEGDGEAEDDTESIEDAIKQLKEDQKNHILQDKHNWNKLTPDPKDPNNWNVIAALMSKVLSEGSERFYKYTSGGESVYIKALEIKGEIVEVTYMIIDGIYKIGDAWVK